LISTIFALLAASANPLAPAAAGKVQCYHPDQVHHTCRSVANYQPRNDGRYDGYGHLGGA
jgi:hypothetical protein